MFFYDANINKKIDLKGIANSIVWLVTNNNYNHTTKPSIADRSK